MWRIFTVTAIIFFIPGCILGTISPVVVKLTLQSLKNAGNVIGKIYAFSTLGAIIGTFATGFYLISWLSTRNIVFVMAIVLIVTALLSGGLFKRKVPAAAFLLVCAIALVPLYLWAFKVPLKNDGAYFYKESDYYTIKLRRAYSLDGRTPLQQLILDHLIHSYVNLDNPLHIEYPYERIYAEVMRWRYRPRDAFRSLSIGGGGYTFPRYMEITYPKANIDVVEIDPAVTEVAHRYLGLPPTTRIKTFNMDGRWFMMNCKEQYDVIFTDAFNDLSIPYHLTTRNSFELKDHLDRDGILMSNTIDNFQRGAFLPSYMRTLQDVFGEKNVYLLSVSPDFEHLRISTFIVIASKGTLDMKAFDGWLKHKLHGKAKSVLVSESLTNRLLASHEAMVLTDEYAPVDDLIAPIFEERFGYNRHR